MGLAKILPRPFRFANFYVKAKKVVASNISNEEKRRVIDKLELKRGGEKYFLDPSVKPSMVCLIGKSDIGKIYIKAGDYEKALRYFDSAWGDLQTVTARNEERRSAYTLDNMALIPYHQAEAYIRLGEVSKAAKLFDNANIYLNRVIADDPSNSRAIEIYEYLITQTYFEMGAGEKLYPEHRGEYYSAAKLLFELYDSRDKGNELINKYLPEYRG